ncbi:MAG: hypothetical protein ACI4RO_00770 [Candidatus Scatosoma sp.]
MYYLIKGIVHDSEDKEIIESTFEWAVMSEEEKENALAALYENEEVTGIEEITLEQCIAHEEKILHNYVQKDYLMRRCGEMEEEEYYATEKELSERTELYLRALREYNRREVLMKRLMRRKNIENIRMGEYLKILNEMLAAKTDEEMQKILRRIDKK